MPGAGRGRSPSPARRRPPGRRRPRRRPEPEPEPVDEDDFDGEDDGEDFDDEDFHGDDDRSNRRGWTGPIIIAIVVSLVAVGLYLVFVKGGDSPPSGARPTPTVTGPPAKVLRSSEAVLAGKAMLGGTYNCFNGTTTKMVTISDRLVVSPNAGTYTWNGVQGTYTISRKSYSSKAEVFSDVTFTSGPLRAATADSYMVGVGQSDGGGDSGLLTFKDGSSRFCVIG